MSTVIACLFLLMDGLLGLSPCDAAEEKVVRVATLSDFPPHCFKKRGVKGPAGGEKIPPGGDSSRLQGCAWEVVRESFHQRGYTIILHVAPWSRCMHYLDTGKMDVLFPAMKTPEREKRFMFSKEPVIRSSFVVYVSASAELEWEGLRSLKGRRIVGVQGWAFGKEWEENEDIVKVEAYSILQGFEMISKGWVFGMVGYDVPFDYVLRRQGLADRFRKLPSWGSAQEFIMGAGERKRATELISAFDTGKRRITENGTLDAIWAKWAERE